MSELFAASGINWQLLIVQAINFGLLLFILWYFLYTPILKLIDDRQKKIAEGVKTAEARANSVLEEASARAEEAKRMALSESSKEIARAAVLAAEKILQTRG